jgi:hypothetical protein
MFYEGTVPEKVMEPPVYFKSVNYTQLDASVIGVGKILFRESQLKIISSPSTSLKDL